MVPTLCHILNMNLSCDVGHISWPSGKHSMKRNLVAYMWRALDGPLTLAHMTRNLKERMPNMLHENGSAWIVALGSRIQNSLSIKARPVTMHTHKSNNKVRQLEMCAYEPGLCLGTRGCANGCDGALGRHVASRRDVMPLV